MPPSPLDIRALLSVLTKHRVEFIIVGGVGCVLQGAPIATFDLDIVHQRTPANLDRLLAALDELDAVFRDPGGRRIRPTGSHLAGLGHCLLITRSGPLDVLGAIGSRRDYDSLKPNVEELDLGDGLLVQVLDLAELVEIKEEAGRDKDRAVLPTLRAALAERDRKG